YAKNAYAWLRSQHASRRAQCPNSERVTIYEAEFRSLSAAARKPATVNHSSNRPLEQFSGTQSRPEASSAQSKSSLGDPNRTRFRHVEAYRIPTLRGRIRICRELPVL